MPGICLQLCFLCLVAFSSACYIQNCPRGGKRSFLDTEIRQCMSCGPRSRGHCFGPYICCGEEFGCYVGTAETLRCLEENYLPSPCEAGGRPCSVNGGRCATAGICCTDESCAMDSSCLEGDSENRRVPSGRNITLTDGAANDFLLRLMHLAKRQQQLQQEEKHLMY
ncbi:vasotocin-neurophysin VT-like [Protopterus annectens]|uniref:Prepro-vasotocin n=1 Tax=Protopterus annectens TaxID=7888 RepID=B3XZZ1_PROAN|nr:vasotocin-neurophysin VT-like [Protopterus annectens]BAG66061.1 prepro-vasotocin [Protopterus annectens]